MLNKLTSLFLGISQFVERYWLCLEYLSGRTSNVLEKHAHHHSRGKKIKMLVGNNLPIKTKRPNKILEM